MNQDNDTTGYLVMGALVGVLGILGIVMAANAVDQGIYWFGLALAAFAVFYIFFAINRSHAAGK